MSHFFLTLLQTGNVTEFDNFFKKEKEYRRFFPNDCLKEYTFMSFKSSCTHRLYQTVTLSCLCPITF